jgi:signal transduction histidine kinase
MPALARHVASIPDGAAVIVRVDGPAEAAAAHRSTEAQLFGVGREALANVVKHAEAQTASVRVEATP